MGRRLSWLLTGSLALTGTALLGPPAQAATTGLFAPYVATMPGSSPANVAIGDVTGDGRPDVVMTTGYNADPAHDFSLFVYPQQADGTLGSPSQVTTHGTYGSHMGIALADLDGDGRLDAAVSTEAGVEIYLQTPSGLAYAWTVPVAEGHDVRLADVSGDGRADLVVNAQDGIHVWWQVNGDLAPSPTGEHLGTTFRTEVEVGDVTGDGRADLVSATGSTMEVWAQNADQSFAAPTPYVTGTGTTDAINGLAIGDIDGDGRADVHASVGGNRPSAWVVTWPQLSGGLLGKPLVRTSYDIPEPVEAGDVTGDGRPDLLTLHGGWNRLGLYDSTPGTIPSETLYPVPYASHYAAEGLAVGDVTGDGRADVVVADYNNGLVLLRNVPPGTDTTAPQTTITSGPPATLLSRTATFAFSADEAATFSCSLDAGAWTPCTSPATYGNLSQSAHRFAVRATDLAGNVDATPATSSFVVDGPDTAITGGTSGTIRSTSASFTFSSTPTAASYECSMDGSPWQACTSGQTWTGLSTGASHTFRVRGVSSEGLVDSTPASRNFDVAPAVDLAVTLSGAPSTVRKNGTVTWTSTVGNLGPQTAADVALTQGLPSGLTFSTVTAAPSAPTSATASCSASGSPATVRCTLGNVAAGLTWTVTVTCTVTATKGSLASTAAASTSTWDLSSANDSASAAVTVSNGNGH
ncbi:MAG: FG-GAP-like repeat-containing protein [Nocardioides sp.]